MSSNGVWYMAHWVDAFTYANTYNFPWTAGTKYQPLTGDWDSEGMPDIGMRDTANGAIYLRARRHAPPR